MFGTDIAIKQVMMSRPAQLAAEGGGIKAHPFVAGELKEVFQAWGDGTLLEPRFSMPGCRRGCRRRRRQNNN